jgi:hypothetical protein
MSSRPRIDPPFLLSLGILPIAACGIDVGEGLTLGSLTGASAEDSANGTGDDGNDDGDGNGGDDDDDGGDDGDGDDGDDGITADGGDAPDDSGGDPTADGDATTGFDPDGAGDEAPGTTVDPDDAEGGAASPVCDAWAMHAASCGGDSYVAATYCQYDLGYAQYIGGDCPALVEDYYSCLTTTDCSELVEPAPTLCGIDEIAAACGGGTDE